MDTIKKNNIPSLDRIIALTAAAFGFSRETISGPSLARDVALVRGMVALVAHPFGYSYETIGKKLNRKHSAMVLAKGRAKGETRLYPEVAKKYNTILSKLELQN